MDFEVVPGVPPATAVLTYAGIPPATSVPEFRVVDAAQDQDWSAHAACPGTLVIYNGITEAVAIGKALIAAWQARHARPWRSAASGTTTEQYTVVSTLGRLQADLKHAGSPSPR